MKPEEEEEEEEEGRAQGSVDAVKRRDVGRREGREEGSMRRGIKDKAPCA